MNHKQTTTTLTELCREESQRYRRKGRAEQRGACYELFRRAIVEKNQEAWQAVYQQYRKLVMTWAQTGDDQVEDLVNDAFMRFFKTVQSDTFTQKFAGIGKVMAFLRLCAQSAKIDMLRKQKKAELVSLDDVMTKSDDSMASDVLKKIRQQKITTYIQSRLKDDQERLVFFLSFESGLKPRQIYAKHAQEFKNVKEIRRIKERIMLRLRNDPNLRRL